MMKEIAEILIEGVRYSFDPETEYMKDGHANVNRKPLINMQKEFNKKYYKRFN